MHAALNSFVDLPLAKGFELGTSEVPNIKVFAEAMK